VQIDAQTHPDFYPATRPADAHEFPIELMRELCANFSLKSARGRGKVILIDDADDLNEESANCFLKTLEEPPPRSVLILIGSSPERQLPTIVSRCQVVRFAPLPSDVVDAILKQNEVDDAQKRERLVRLGGGSPGVALELADEDLWTFRGKLLKGLTASPIDPVALNKEWTEFVEEAAVQRRRARRALRLVIDVLSDALAVTQGSSPRRTMKDDEPLVRKLADRGGEALLAVIDRCLEADQQIEWRVQLVLVLEALLDALAQKMAA
jgi:DNA polymerase-3 subunit delta'